jgi:arginine-tRNA-protein transferase
MKDELTRKQFYLTPSHPCSYLPAQRARTLFLDPREPVDDALYGLLTRAGFRRSGSHLYRPRCEDCNACVSVRVPVDRFAPSRRYTRVLARNGDLDLTVERPAYSREIFDLYARYIRERHADGDMHPATAAQFRSFLLSSWTHTRFLTFRHQTRLVAIAVTDTLVDGLSAIYTFFDPDLAPRSLGVYAILSQIAECKRRGLPYLYLGYWIRDCAKMSYKIQYRPVELLMHNRWVLME